jgi:hypothetical protein
LRGLARSATRLGLRSPKRAFLVYSLVLRSSRGRSPLLGNAPAFDRNCSVSWRSAVVSTCFTGQAMESEGSGLSGKATLSRDRLVFLPGAAEAQDGLGHGGGGHRSRGVPFPPNHRGPGFHGVLRQAYWPTMDISGHRAKAVAEIPAAESALAASPCPRGVAWIGNPIANP